MVSEAQEARMNSLDLVELTPMGHNTRTLIKKNSSDYRRQPFYL